MSTGRAPGTQKRHKNTKNSWICLKTHKENFYIILLWCQNFCFSVPMHTGIFSFLDSNNHRYPSLHRLAMSNIIILVWKIATSKPVLIQGEFQPPEHQARNISPAQMQWGHWTENIEINWNQRVTARISCWNYRSSTGAWLWVLSATLDPEGAQDTSTRPAAVPEGSLKRLISLWNVVWKPPVFRDPNVSLNKSKNGNF